jgi:putative methyltransferase (TIGR04325 family)
MSAKSFARELVPPLLLRAYRRARGAGICLDGPYASWHDAQSQSSGYKSDVILSAVRTALLKVKSGEAACERDSVVFDSKQYSFPVLAGLLHSASSARSPLTVLDYGGSLGSAYFLYRDLVCPNGSLSWLIVEQPQFVACGKRDFESTELKFFETLDDAWVATAPNVVLFSSVLQYLECPYDVLDQIARRAPHAIIIDRTPFHDGTSDIIAVQKVPPEIYDANYPSWIFGTAIREKLAAAGYGVQAAWDSPEGVVERRGVSACYGGLWLRRAKSDFR